MFKWVLIFLGVAIGAAVIGLSGLAGAATEITWILFVVGLVGAAIAYFTDRGPRIP